MRIARFVRAAGISVVTTAALVGSSAGTAAAPAGSTVVQARVVVAATVPSTCGGVLERVIDGQLTGHGYVGGRFTARGATFPLSFGGVVETPTTMTVARVFDGSITWLAVRSDGSLWRVDGYVDSEALTTSMVSPSGWGGVRHISASKTYTRMYALTTSGGLYRYSLNSNGVPRGLGPVATSGYGAVKFLSAIRSNVVFDLVVGVSTAGSLRQYAINRSTGAISGGSIKPSGWDQISYISVGDCSTGTGVPMVAIHNRGGAYGYYDANASDFNGSDITGVGQIGWGFTGLILD